MDKENGGDAVSYPVCGGNRIRRLAERASYDKATVWSIIDGSYLCHVAFVHDGRPVVIPMAHWRIGDALYLHAANKGRLATACVGHPVAVSIAAFDGIVLAHSAFNHTYNYRSVVVQGCGEAVDASDEKARVLKAFVDHIIAGRWETLRPMTDAEMRATTVIRIPLAEVAAKIRDDFADPETCEPDWPVWVGMIPARLTFGDAQPDPRCNRIEPVPDAVREYRGIDGFISRYRDGAPDD